MTVWWLRLVIHGWGRVVAVMLAATTLAACDTAIPSATTTTSPASELTELPHLEVVEPMQIPRYDRDDWQPNGWADEDGDGCNTRAEVLIAETTSTPEITRPCKVVFGDWSDAFSGFTTTTPAKLEIDHLVALADAHRSGGWAWPPAKKLAYANDLSDPDHLNAMLGSENQRKADDGPDGWLPKEVTSRCRYVHAYARIKQRWKLSVTPAQWQALVVEWRKCEN